VPFLSVLGVIIFFSASVQSFHSIYTQTSIFAFHRVKESDSHLLKIHYSELSRLDDDGNTSYFSKRHSCW